VPSCGMLCCALMACCAVPSWHGTPLGTWGRFGSGYAEHGFDVWVVRPAKAGRSADSLCFLSPRWPDRHANTCRYDAGKRCWGGMPGGDAGDCWALRSLLRGYFRCQRILRQCFRRMTAGGAFWFQRSAQRAPFEANAAKGRGPLAPGSWGFAVARQ
jgi:hypothetical protein